KLESSRHTYMELTNLSALGAEYIGKIPDDVDVERGYHIDEVGVKPRSEVIAIRDQSPEVNTSAILSVVIPIYNNGSHLLHKCIASLRRSNIFAQMELILVDDGSTDVGTIEAIKQIERELERVQVYRFGSGGSGSASRPRNKGLEIASCDYITYLDPDNEALNDAYVKLPHRTIETGVDFTVGDMTR